MERQTVCDQVDPAAVCHAHAKTEVPKESLGDDTGAGLTADALPSAFQRFGSPLQAARARAVDEVVARVIEARGGAVTRPEEHREPKSPTEARLEHFR